METAVFAGGCFWCTEAVFSSLKGVISVTPGYTGGRLRQPTYEQVCEMETGHAESVRITYDPSVISYDDLLAVFFNVHDPTTVNRQGGDVGTQYRSVIFYTTPTQKEKALKLINELNSSKAYDKPVVTEVVSLGEFFEAESYHRDYFRNNSDQAYCQLVIAPKLEKLRERFEALIKP